MLEEKQENEINFTITNSNIKPVSQSESYLINFLEKEEPPIDSNEFEIEFTSVSAELLVNDKANLSLMLTEGTNVPDDTTYILKLESNLAGVFEINGEPFNMEDGVSINPGNTTINYIGSVIGDHTITVLVENSYENSISKTEDVLVRYVGEVSNTILVTSVSVNPTDMLLTVVQPIEPNIGFSFTVTINPDNATNKEFRWISDEPSIV